MTEGWDELVGAFNDIDPTDFTDGATLAAKLATVDRAFVHGLFDIEGFVDRCVRRTEEAVRRAGRTPCEWGFSHATGNRRGAGSEARDPKSM